MKDWWKNGITSFSLYFHFYPLLSVSLHPFLLPHYKLFTVPKLTWQIYFILHPSPFHLAFPFTIFHFNWFCFWITFQTQVVFHYLHKTFTTNLLHIYFISSPLPLHLMKESNWQLNVGPLVCPIQLFAVQRMDTHLIEGV